MKKLLVFLIGLLGLATLAQADPWHRHPHEMRYFHQRDIYMWRGGMWFHGPYLGRVGWWWIVGGVYYYYPAPIYPYPDPYVPGGVVMAPAPAPVPVMPAPAAPLQAQDLPPVWYYCDASKSYYPYVSECPTGWRTVPAKPSK